MSNYEITSDFEVDLRGFFYTHNSCPSKKLELAYSTDTLPVDTFTIRVPYEAGTSRSVVVTASQKTNGVTASFTMSFESIVVEEPLVQEEIQGNSTTNETVKEQPVKESQAITTNEEQAPQELI